ncbi:hATC-domain-containing protein [Polyporus arcularius HHB13444]|uniref:HATC-domain-containing protein n=1 Tax=Polyporus arcularius HHB13444 TaxID=1314778 RepID=A0A5C3NY33_9APHY|nr:hATC-domain-containing protein [Polyporus arcularius HHB13444]
MQAAIPTRSKEPLDELDRYLKADIEDVKDPIAHWNESKKLYPRLSQMALDYHAIPPTSVEVERVFSRGRLLLSHVRSALSPATTRAVLCLGQWSLLELVHKDDLEAVAQLPEL